VRDHHDRLARLLPQLEQLVLDAGLVCRSWCALQPTLCSPHATVRWCGLWRWKSERIDVRA
jgi:hypothetical protein